MLEATKRKRLCGPSNTATIFEIVPTDRCLRQILKRPHNWHHTSLMFDLSLFKYMQCFHSSPTMPTYLNKKVLAEMSLVIQGLRLCAPNAGGTV